MCKYVDNLSFLRETLNKFFLLVILTWSGVRSCSKILQKRLKRRHILPSAQKTENEFSLGQRVKNHGNGWLTSTKTQVWTEEKTLWGRGILYHTFFPFAWGRSFETASFCFKFWLFSSRRRRKLILWIFSKSKRTLLSHSYKSLRKSVFLLLNFA